MTALLVAAGEKFEPTSLAAGPWGNRWVLLDHLTLCGRLPGGRAAGPRHRAIRDRGSLAFGTRPAWAFLFRTPEAVEEGVRSALKRQLQAAYKVQRGGKEFIGSDLRGTQDRSRHPVVRVAAAPGMTEQRPPRASGLESRADELILGRVEAIAGSAGHLCDRDHLVFHLLNFRHQLIERGRLHLAARMHQNDDTVTDVSHHGLRD